MLNKKERLELMPKTRLLRRRLHVSRLRNFYKRKRKLDSVLRP